MLRLFDEIRKELVEARDEAEGMWLTLAPPVYEVATKLPDILVQDGKEFVLDHATSKWRRLKKSEREQFKRIAAADAKFIDEHRFVSTWGLGDVAFRLNGQGLQPFLTRFVALADRVMNEVEAVLPASFPLDRLPPLQVPEAGLGDLDMCLFGLDKPDTILAGKLLLVWSAWASEGNESRPEDYRRRYNIWSRNLVATDEHELKAFVRWEPFRWAINAFDEFTAIVKPSPAVGSATNGWGDGKPKKPTQGRPKESDPAADRKIAEAWATKRYKDYAELAAALRKTRAEVRGAIDRHRKRQRNIAE